MSKIQNSDFYINEIVPEIITLANNIDRLEYGQEPEDSYINFAKENRLVIMFNEDDLMKFRGAINDEIDSFVNGNLVYINNNGLLKSDCKSGIFCPHFDKLKDEAYKIEAIYDNIGYPDWKYETTIPYETFDIYDGDDLYCEGIVFSLDYLKSTGG